MHWHRLRHSARRSYAGNNCLYCFYFWPNGTFALIKRHIKLAWFSVEPLHGIFADADANRQKRTQATMHAGEQRDPLLGVSDRAKGMIKKASNDTTIRNVIQEFSSCDLFARAQKFFIGANNWNCARKCQLTNHSGVSGPYLLLVSAKCQKMRKECDLDDS
jgi:hypothetical protein